MKNMNIQFTDRYEALGIPYPDPKTMCGGECEGTGWIPIKRLRLYDGYDAGGVSVKDFEEDTLWQIAHKNYKGKNIFKTLFHRWLCDDWHFIKCPECKGTGKGDRKI